jgi:hypothetical protein
MAADSITLLHLGGHSGVVDTSWEGTPPPLFPPGG